MDSNATFVVSEDGSSHKKQKTDQIPNTNTNTDTDTIIIKFTNNKNDQPFYCTVKKTIPFKKIFQTYRRHFRFDGENVEFLYEDHRLLDNLTPEDINFPDGGEIDAMIKVGGGGGGCNGPPTTS